jgi:restriction system protein
MWCNRFGRYSAGPLPLNLVRWAHSSVLLWRQGFHPSFLRTFVSASPPIIVSMSRVPQYNQLMNPLLRALRDLGGSGSVDEIYEKVAENLRLPEEVLAIPHNPEKSNQTEVQYRLAWARTYLKKYGVLENSSRGVWVIAPEQRHIEKVDPQEVVRVVRELSRSERAAKGVETSADESTDDEAPEEVRSWRTQLYNVLTQKLDPSGFERLVKRVLRESGFVHVEVTGRSGDGGIDGKGIARLSGMLSFHVIFQCKRYQGAVSSGHIRDFRGAMVGRADKGLLLTTGTFTRDAIREATRDGAPPIDLIDGDQLADKLKELGLGLKTEFVEKVSVDEGWFLTL